MLHVKKKSFFLFQLLLIPFILIFGLYLFCDLGERPVGPNLDSLSNRNTITIDSVTSWEDGIMEIHVNPTEVPASDSKIAVVTVRLYNKTHNPIKGSTIYFESNYGVIQSKSTTDSFGIALATFKSEPINVEAAITAYIIDNRGMKIKVQQIVSITGMNILIQPYVSKSLPGTTVPVTVTVKDADGVPAVYKSVFLYLNGIIHDTLITKSNGMVYLSVRSSLVQNITIRAESQGTFSVDTVEFTNNINNVIDSTNTIRQLRLFSSKNQLKADNTDFALITAVLIDENNNPSIGDTIQFSAKPYGIIGSTGIIDSTGMAIVKLRSTPVNCVCQVTAIALKSGQKASLNIKFCGVSLKLSANPDNLKINEISTVEALVADASSHPIEGDTVKFVVKDGIFDNGTTMKSVVLNPDGIAAVKVTSKGAGTVLVNATANNCTDSTKITFTNNTLTLTATPSMILIGGAASVITATYKDGNNNVLSGQRINFYTNAGTLESNSIITKSDGTASAILKSCNFSTTARVDAIAPNGNAQVYVNFVSTIAKNVLLLISPDNIGVNGGVATLTAKVTDSSGNMVTGADINFKIISGPGGGEHIDNPVVTSKDGIARAKLYAGSIPSQYRACQVIAFIGNIGDTSKMTISGEPYVVTVARPQDDTVIVTNAGQLNDATFDFFIGAVVQDVNGNPVADGMEVHFSAVVSGLVVGKKLFDKWVGGAMGETIKPSYKYSALDITFEDINNNFQFDPGVDLNIDGNAIASRGDDANGDGIMDYDLNKYDLYYDFNNNAKCDSGIKSPEPCLNLVCQTETIGHIHDTIPVFYYDTIRKFVYDTIFGNGLIKDSIILIIKDSVIRYIKDSAIIIPVLDTIDIGCPGNIYADLNNNGRWDKSELIIDHDLDGICDLPVSGDFQNWLWEKRPQFEGLSLDFSKNDFAVAIATSAVTKNGVANTKITYPRQMALRLRVTVNAEINGIRDRDGERFTLPIVKSGK